MATTKENKRDRGARGAEKTPPLARPNLRLVIYVSVHLLSAGFASGLFWLWTASDVGDQHDHVAQPTTLSVEQATRTGDSLLLQAKSEEAIEMYRYAATASSPSAVLAYRMGLCAEQLGELDTAEDYYTSLTERDPSSISFAAKLGQARIRYRKRKLDECINVLASMAAVSATDVYSTTRLGLDVEYFLALVESELALVGIADSRLDSEHVFRGSMPISIQHLLELVPIDENQLSVPTDVGFQEGIQIHGNARSPSTTLLSAQARNQPIAFLLDSLASTTGWEFKLTPVAREIGLARRVDVYVRDQTAAEFLSLILNSEGLFWTFEGQSIAIAQTTNMDSNALVTRSRKRADELLQRALAVSPDHFLAPDAYLALGNLAALDGRIERAEAFYGQLIERFPKHVTSQIATFNWAKTAYANRRVAVAVERFDDVVNARRGSELEPLSYLYLGRIHFDGGDLKAAKIDLSRSVALTDDDEISAAAALTLASAYLIQKDPSAAVSANAVLMERRDTLRRPQFRAPAAFLSALTLFRTAVTDIDVRRRGRDLLAACVQVSPTDFFGGFGYQLIGEALTDVGLTEEAIRLYREGLDAALSEETRYQLLFCLATEYRKQDQNQLAQDKLRELSESSSPSWAPKAAMELADILLRTREFDECIRYCRWCLQQGFPEETQMAILRTLGRVYEELDDPVQAGHCFAGFLPSDDKTDQVQR